MFTIIGGDGKAYGPVSMDQIRRWIAENRVTLDTQAKALGSEQWQPLRNFPEFIGGAAGAAPPALGGAEGAAASASTPPPERIEFTGEWQEYFKIWIVNVLLTIVTLGIYAAWAKVRKRRYFCANTRVFGHTFEYLADPVKILYGNLIVGVLFALLSFSQVISMGLYVCLALLFAIAVPWFIARALAFNARNTAWRGLRFNFTGTYGGAAAAFLGWPLLVPFTAGLIFPFVAQKQKNFIVNHHAYGTSPFSFTAEAGAFYKIYGIAMLFFAPAAVCYFAAFAAMAVESGMLVMFLLIPIAIALVVAGSFYLQSRLFNLIWNNTSLAGNRFTATMRARDLCLVHLVNSLVTLVTFGLMHPWAAVRLTKYQLGCLEIAPAGNIDAFVAAAQPPVNALGEAASDFFDFDLGFGV